MRLPNSTVSSGVEQLTVRDSTTDGEGKALCGNVVAKSRGASWCRVLAIPCLQLRQRHKMSERALHR